MRNVILTLLALVFSTQATAQSFQRGFRDLKLPTQVMIEKQTFVTPVLADVDRILEDAASSDTDVTVIDTFLAQPDVCRALSITPTGTTNDVAAMSITVTGTNIFGATITEAFAFAENASTVTNGVKAFCTVSEVSIPAQDGAGATFDVGVQDKLGLKRCTDNAGAYAWSVFNGAYETTRGVLTAHASEVEKNLFDPQGTLDGAKNVELYFVQNWSCFP